jgi:hypothetical protein
LQDFSHIRTHLGPICLCVQCSLGGNQKRGNGHSMRRISNKVITNEKVHVSCSQANV